MVLFLKSPFFIENGIPRMTGTAGQKRLPGDYFAYRPFPLPPLAEQHRIVAKVDELMQLCDRLESSQQERESRRNRLVVASLNRLSQPTDPDEFKKDAEFQLSNLSRLSTKPEHIKELRKAILNLAVRGKLVPQDEREGTAADVLDAIKTERQKLIDRGTVRREKPVAAIASSEIPFPIPSTWEWARIADIFLFTQYGTSQKGSTGTSGVPVLAMGNIQDGKVLLGKAKTIPATSEDLPGLYLRHCDLLYNRTNSAELVGKTGLFLGEDDRYTFASYLIRLRPSLTATAPAFLNRVISSSVFRETQIVPHIKKQTGQANVNGTALRNMLIPLPPLAEQKRIVAKVDELMLICDQLETQLEYQQKGRHQLLEALLHEALKGVG
jgi:type I restriction enzyme S subunit